LSLTRIEVGELAASMRWATVAITKAAKAEPRDEAKDQAPEEVPA
jgi:hypothetical protein